MDFIIFYFTSTNKCTHFQCVLYLVYCFSCGISTTEHRVFDEYDF